MKAQLQGIVARARGAIAKFAGAGGLFRRVAEKTAGLRAKILAALDRLLGKIPKERRRMVLIAAIGGLAAVLLVIAGASLATRGRPAEQQAVSQPPRVVIPPDELFLPFEPDFVPGVMLGRERRSEWTEEDAASLWQNPLKNGEQEWRNLIEETVDKIMESVP